MWDNDDARDEPALASDRGCPRSRDRGRSVRGSPHSGLQKKAKHPDDLFFSQARRRLAMTQAPEGPGLQGHVSPVTILASWCQPCRVEHLLFMELSRGGEVPLCGTNLKDLPNKAKARLEELRKPHARIRADLPGRGAIKWRACGLPETFLISADRTVSHRHVEPLSQQYNGGTIMPLVRKLKDENAARMKA